MGVSIINLVLLVGVCLLLTNIALNCLFHTENKTYLVYACGFSAALVAGVIAGVVGCLAYGVTV